MAGGRAEERIAARLGLDPKMVRRYITVAEGIGLRVGADAVSETQLRDVLLAMHRAAADRGATIGIGVARSTTRFAAG